MSRAIELVARIGHRIGHRIGKPPGWERVVRLVSPPERCRTLPELRVVRDGTTFTAQRGTLIGWHVAFFGAYEPELRDVFRAVLPAGGVAVDAGANVGWHTLLMARLVGERGRVLAIEPNPSVGARLVAHLQQNRIAHVDVVGCALSDAPGICRFAAPDASDTGAGGGHVLAQGEASAHRAIDVPARTLDALFGEAGLERLDLLKVDVEGYEWPVLAGAERTIARYRPHVVFEYVDESAHRGGGTAARFEAFFERHRYRVSTVGRKGARDVAKGAWPRVANLWARPR